MVPWMTTIITTTTKISSSLSVVPVQAFLVSNLPSRVVTVTTRQQTSTALSLSSPVLSSSSSLLLSRRLAAPTRMMSMSTLNASSSNDHSNNKQNNRPNGNRRRRNKNRNQGSRSSSSSPRNGNNHNNSNNKVASSSSSSSLSVAIIGGGISGLSCARHLLTATNVHTDRDAITGVGGVDIGDVTVFDTGRLRPGGRASSRHPNDAVSASGTESPSLLDTFHYDHAAQFITIPRRPQSTSSSSSSSQSSSPSSSSWRTEFDRWVVDELYHQQGLLAVAPPDTVFSIEMTTTTTNTGTNPSSHTDTQKVADNSNDDDNDDSTTIRFESLQTSYDFFYPKNGMSALSNALVRGSSTDEEEDDEGTRRPSVAISTISDNDDETTLSFHNIPSIDVKQDVWVSPSNGVKYLPERNQWRLSAKGKSLGDYDRLIIAHNGKCADRLMSRTPAKRLHRLLRVNFNDHTPPDGGKKMTLNSIYSYTVCLKSPSLLKESLPDNFIAGFVRPSDRQDGSNSTKNTNNDASSSPPSSEPIIAAITNQVPGKYKAPNGEDVEVWTIFSTSSFAKQHKAPQEFLPEDVIEDVSTALLGSLQNDIIAKRQPKSQNNDTTKLQDQVLDERIQLWGAGLPINVWESTSTRSSSSPSSSLADAKATGFLYDSEFGVGCCGDWLVEPSIAGSWTSGKRLADHILSTTTKQQHHNSKSSSSASRSIGLDGGRFRSSPSVQRFGIGALLDTTRQSSGNDKPQSKESKGTSSSSSRSRNTSRRNGASRRAPSAKEEIVR